MYDRVTVSKSNMQISSLLNIISPISFGLIFPENSRAVVIPLLKNLLNGQTASNPKVQQNLQENLLFV